MIRDFLRFGWELRLRNLCLEESFIVQRIKKDILFRGDKGIHVHTDTPIRAVGEDGACRRQRDGKFG